MIISFAQTASYWMQQYEQALAKQHLDEALRYIHKALETDTSFEVWFAYAELLQRAQLYDMSAAVCLRYARQKMTIDEKQEWCRLMVKNAHATGNFPALFHYNHMLLTLSQSDEETEELFYDIVTRLFAGEEGEEDGLQFSDDAHQDQNRTVYDEIMEAYQREDYATVLALFEEIHPDYDFYTEALFAVGKSQLALGLTAEGLDTLCTMYTRSGYDVRVLYHICQVPDGLPVEQLQQYLVQANTSTADALGVAAMCACLIGLDQVALDYALRAYRLAPLDPYTLFRLAGAYANVGEVEQCTAYLQQVVSLYPDFYPTDLLRTVPDRYDLCFTTIPCELLAEVVMYVAEVLAATPDCREDDIVRDIYLLMAHGFPEDYKQAVFGWFQAWTDAASLEFAANLLAEPLAEPDARRLAMHHLLHYRRRGRVNVARHYLCELYSLRVPPSYDDYSAALQRSYAYAFYDMATFGLHNERKLGKLFEQLYLAGFDVGYSPEMAAFAVLVAGGIAPKKIPLHDHLVAHGFDDVAFQFYFDAVRAALAKE